MNRMKLIGTHTRRNHRTVITALVSGKGGVGKSIIAFNLAWQLATAGRKTLLVDCDWHFGNAHLLANVIPTGIPVNALTEDEPLSEATTAVGENLDLIAAPSAYDANDEMSTDGLGDVLTRLSKESAAYDVILLDSPSGSIDIISQVTGVASLNLIVVVPELTAISDGYGLFKYLAGAGRHTTAHVLVNRAQNANDAVYIQRKLMHLTGKFLRKAPLDAGYLLEDKAVATAVGKQIAVAEISAEAPVMTGLTALAEYVQRETSVSHSGTAVSSSQQVNSETFSADIRE